MLVAETLRRALNELAERAPEWLIEQVNEDWFDRYGARIEKYRLPKNKGEQEELALLVGADGHHILDAIYAPETDSSLRELKGVKILRELWVQQYAYVKGNLVWRQQEKNGLPPQKLLIESPYDPEARNSTKRETNWTGYKIHISETCDEDEPHIITNVETTPATTPDGDLTQQIHEALAEKELLPAEHILDSAYMDAEHIVTSEKEYNINLIGRVNENLSWQAKENKGFDFSCFLIDWENKCVKCPEGNFSKSWKERNYSKEQFIEVRFEAKTCGACPRRDDCTHSQKKPRQLKLKPQPFHEALQTARLSQKTSEFKRSYAVRAGVEGTISQGIRAFDLRRSRYMGLAKTHLQHIATAAAINLHRLFDWWQDVPKAKTRISRFARLKEVVCS